MLRKNRPAVESAGRLKVSVYSQFFRERDLKSIFQAVERGGDAAAATDEGFRREIMHRHD